MPRQPLYAIAPVVALLLGACSDLPTERRIPQPSFARHTVPFSGTCESVIQPGTPIGPGIIRQVDVGDCVLALMGQSTLLSDKVINFVQGTQQVQLTLTGANGDALNGSGSGISSMVAPGRVEFRAEVTISGGTGRFADAAGGIVIEGHADIVNGRSYQRFSGNMTY